MIVLVTLAAAAPLNLFGGLADGGAVSVAPTVYAAPSGATPILYGTIGVGGTADLMLGVGTDSDWTGAVGAGTVDAMARYGLTDDLVLGVHAGMSFDSPVATIGPELHWTHSFGPVDLTANAGWRVATDGAGSTAAVGVAPEVWLGSRVSAYVEVDPSVALSASAAPALALQVVPGLSFDLSGDGTHALCAGVQLPVGDENAEVSVGVWYSVTMGPSRYETVASAE